LRVSRDSKIKLLRKLGLENNRLSGERQGKREKGVKATGRDVNDTLYNEFTNKNR